MSVIKTKRTALLASALILIGPGIAAAQEKLDLSIAGQPLPQALAELANEANVQIAFRSRSEFNTPVPALEGSFTPEAALAQLLTGTGLVARRASDRAFVIERLPDTVTQAAGEDESFLLETLIFGELQTRSLRDSPTSAIVETGTALEERGDADIYDAIERAPNVSTTFGGKGFVVRGIQTNGAVSNVQLNGTLVSVQVDGVALNNYQSTFFGPYSTWDIDQIEILRGPQSTQQGRNAMAGAIIINTRDPEFFPEYRFRVEGGSRNTQRFALALNQPVSDTVALRFSAETNSTDGYVTSRALDDDEYDARDYESYRGKLRWQPNDRFDAVLEYSYTESTGGEDYVLDSEFPDQRVTDQTADALEGSVHKSLGLTATYEINPNLILESQTNFYQQDYDRIEGFADPLPVGESRVEIDGSSDTFEQDIQLKFDMDRYRGVVGFFYTETSDERPLFTTTDLALLGAPGLSDTLDERFDTDVTNYAIYGEVDVELGNGFTLTAGARYDTEKYEFEQTVDFGPFINGSGLPDIGLQTGKETFEAFLPKIALTYDFNANQAVTFTAQRGYRAGGVSSNLVETLIPGEDSLSNYDPEYSDNFELAYRGAFNSGQTWIGANVFYTKWKDMQVSVPGTPSGTPLDALFNFDTVNAAESELYGFELSAQTQATDNLELFGSIGHTRTKFVEFGEFTGNEFPFAPDWTASFGGKYSWDNGFALGIDASYTAASYQDSANTYRDDSRWLLNAHATFVTRNNVTAGLYVRNLLDEDYATARFESPVGNPTIIRVGEPRTIGAYLQAEF